MIVQEAPVFDAAKYKATTQQQWDVAAAAWDRWTPLLREWLGEATELMLDMAGVQDGSRILEHAAAQARQAGFANVRTEVHDGEHLDVAEASFDAVISRLGLIYFPDQQQALRGMKRALKPGGRVAAIVYSTPDRNGFFSVPVSIIRARAALPPPLPGQPGPFSLGAAGVLEAALTKAGFVDVTSRIVAAPVRLGSAADCVRFEQESFGALHQMLSTLDAAGKAAAWQEIAERLAQFEQGGRFEGPCELVIGVGTRP